MNTYGQGEMMYPSSQTTLMMPSECEKEADGCLHTARPLLTLLFMIEWEKDESELTVI